MSSVGTARQLLSQDFSSNIVKYKYSYVVDILPICKDDLVIFPRKLCGVTVRILLALHRRAWTRWRSA